MDCPAYANTMPVKADILVKPFLSISSSSAYKSPTFPPYLRAKIKQEWHIPHLPSGLKSDPLTKSCIRQIATADTIVRDEITLSHFKPCNDLSCMIGISPYMTNEDYCIRLEQIFTCATYEPTKLARIQGNAIPVQKEKKPEVGRFDGCIAFPAIQNPPG